MPVTPFRVAPIVVMPVLAELASPAGVMMATAGLDEAQLTKLVSVCVVPSLKLPTALNACEPPRRIDGLPGLTVIEVSAALLTARLVVPTTPFRYAVSVVLPAEAPLTWPRLPALLLTVATLGCEDVQAASVVRFCVVPSPKVPIALQNSDVPCAICGVVQLTAIDTRGDAVTVNAAGGEVTPPSAAVMLVVPLATPRAAPLEFTVATLVSDDAQVAIPVRFWVVALLKVPVAAYCTLPAGVMVLLPGVTAIDVSVALLTVSSVEPLAEGPPGLVKLALIVLEPWATPVATPKLPGALLTVAAAVLADCQLATVLMFCVLPSLKLPVAVKRWVVPGAIAGLAGETEMDWILALLTVSIEESLNVPNVSPIMVLPTPLLTARPLAGPMVATAGVDEVQFTPLAMVMFSVLPSLKVAIAVYCRFVPFAMVAFAGCSATPTTLAVLMVTLVDPVMLPEVAEIIDEPSPRAVSNPEVVMVAVPVCDELQVTLLVKFLVELSL